MASPRQPFSCPVCDEDVPAGAVSCPGCGACEKSGWSEDAHPDGLDLPDDDFDYERFTNEEFGTGALKPTSGRMWTVVAAVTLVAFLVSGLGGCWSR